mgnify:FL=1
MWEVYLSPIVSKFLRKTNQNIRIRLEKSLKKLNCENPFQYLEHFESKDYYKYRIGEYRALIDLDFENKIIKVQLILA